MFHVLKSQITPDFEAQVEEYRKALMAHRHTVNEPAPSAPALIENCVARITYPVAAKKPDDFIAEYEIVDDLPLPLTLQEKKDNLLNEVLRGEQRIIDKIVPPGKHRLYTIMRNDLQRKHIDAYANGGRYVNAPHEEKFMADDKDRQVRLDNIHRDVANVLAEIDSLNEETIDTWVIPPDYK